MSEVAPPIDETFAAAASPEQLDRAAEALGARGFVVHTVTTVEEARKLVIGELLPRDRAIFTARSETLRLSGIMADIDESGEFVSVRAQAGDPGDDIWARARLGAVTDVVVGSVHAVTEQGHLIIGSASGSQLAPYASGAKQAIWVVGAQKIVPDLDTGLRRLRTHSLPKEWRRNKALTGRPSFLSRIMIMESEWLPGRGVVVLIREAIGF